MPVPEIEATQYVTYKQVGNEIFDPEDDMLAALGMFTFRVAVGGTVKKIGSKACIYVERIGVYIKDSYDFNGEQILGWWNPETNEGGKNPRNGQYVGNETFRKYQSETGKGQDFLVFSDIITTCLNKPFLVETIAK